MTRRMLQLLWELRTETAKEISALEQSDEIDAWLDDQLMPASVHARDGSEVVPPLELSGLGLSLKTH